MVGFLPAVLFLSPYSACWVCPYNSTRSNTHVIPLLQTPSSRWGAVRKWTVSIDNLRHQSFEAHVHSEWRDESSRWICVRSIFCSVCFQTSPSVEVLQSDQWSPGVSHRLVWICDHERNSEGWIKIQNTYTFFLTLTLSDQLHHCVFTAWAPRHVSARLCHGQTRNSPPVNGH